MAGRHRGEAASERGTTPYSPSGRAAIHGAFIEVCGDCRWARARRIEVMIHELGHAHEEHAGWQYLLFDWLGGKEEFENRH